MYTRASGKLERSHYLHNCMLAEVNQRAKPHGFRQVRKRDVGRKSGIAEHEQKTLLDMVRPSEGNEVRPDGWWEVRLLHSTDEVGEGELKPTRRREGSNRPTNF